MLNASNHPTEGEGEGTAVGVLEHLPEIGPRECVGPHPLHTTHGPLRPHLPPMARSPAHLEDPEIQGG